MKFLLIGDLHAGSRTDSEIFSDYHLSYLETEFLPYLEKPGIYGVYILGDVFDKRKYVNFNTLKKWRERFFEKLEGFNVHVLLGNHDVSFKNTNSVSSVVELLSPYGFEIYSDAVVKTIDEEVLIAPWINDENKNHFFHLLEETTAKTCFGHFELMGFPLMGNILSEVGFDMNILSKFDRVFTGHFHAKSQKGNVRYLGCPYQINWTDIYTSHGFYIYDTKTNELEFIENKNKIFQLIKYNEEEDNLNKDFSEYSNKFIKILTKDIKDQFVFDMFIQKLQKIGPHDISVVELDTDKPISGVTISDITTVRKTLDYAYDCVDNMNIENNRKQEIKHILMGLYTQATNQ